MYRLGKASLHELEQPGGQVHSLLRSYVERTLELTPVDFAVHDGIRTIEEQREYVRSGVSKTMDSYHIPRWTPDGTLGCAVDLVPYINGKLRWEWEPIYQIIAAIHQAEQDAKRKKLMQPNFPHLRWGGVWDKFLFELDPFNLEAEREAYRRRRLALGKKTFSDGPHIQIEFA